MRTDLRRLFRRRPPTLQPAPFVVGAPRSGTTLLRLMLDAHPDLAIPPETYFVPKAAKQWRRIERLRNRSANPRERFYEAVTGHTRWPDFHMDADVFRRRLEEERPQEVGEAVRIFYRLYAERAGKPRWGDKTPFYVRRMAIIQEILPEARFIHIIRDGRDLTLSIKGLWFGPNSIDEAAEFWISRIEEGREQAPSLAHYMELRYEDLLEQPEIELRRICEFVDLPFEEQMLHYHEHVDERLAPEVPPEEIAPDGRVVSTAERQAIMARVSKPPDKTRIGRYRSEMPVEDRERFESIAGPLLQELGYPLD
jgi:hypothetical protein